MQKVQFQVNLCLGIGCGGILEKLLGAPAVDVPASPDKAGENPALFRIKGVRKGYRNPWPGTSFLDWAGARSRYRQSEKPSRYASIP